MIYFQSQVDSIIKSKEEQIAVIREELDRLRKDLDNERRRANNAVDNLLYASGSVRVTPPPPREESKFNDLLGKVSEGLARVGVLPEDDREDLKAHAD